MTLFRGYIKTNGKKAIEPFKNIDTLRTLEEVSNSNGYAGVLNENTILVDFDDEEMSIKALEIIKKEKLNCKVIQTNRGIHVYFKTNTIYKCGTNIQLACGLVADIKCDINSYGILKIGGATRDVLYDSEIYEEIPLYFRPIISKEKQFLNKIEGDRNNALYKYILILQNNSFDNEEIKNIIKFINANIFLEPLDNKEIDVILRDDSFKKRTFNVNGKLSYLEFAKHLVAEKNICRINNKLHMYHNGVYTSNINLIEATMLDYIPTLRSANRVETLKTIELLCIQNKELSSENYISFKNGIYDIENEILLRHDPKYLMLNQIPWNYVENTSNTFAEEILNQWACNDNSIKMLLEEIIGITFYRSNKISSSFILIGDKDNGKSSFIKLIRNILSNDNYSSVSLEDIESRFKNTEICGKLANLGDDIGDGYIPNTQIFKKLITGDRVQFERKGQDPFEYDNYGKLIFSANTIPKIKDETGAVILKRIILVPFNADFSNKKGNPDLYKQLNNPELVEYIICKSIKALKRVISNKGFTVSDKITKAKDNYIYNNDPVLQFIDEYGEDNITKYEVRDILNSYKSFCDDNDYKNFSSNYLSKGINKYLGFTKKKININKNGKKTSTYYYVKA